MELVNGTGNVENHSEKTLIEVNRTLKAETNAGLFHIYREVNRCVDKLAKLGGTQTEQFVGILVPPDDVVEDLMTDMIRVTYPRET